MEYYRGHLLGKTLMRSFSLRLAVLVSLATIFWLASIYLHSQLVNIAYLFFETAEANKPKSTYRLFIEHSQQQFSPKDLEQFILRHNIHDYKSFSWDEQSIKKDIGKLSGTLRTQKGQQIPIEFSFKKDPHQKWKITRIRILNSIKDSILEDFPRATVRQNEPMRESLSLFNNPPFFC